MPKPFGRALEPGQGEGCSDVCLPKDRGHGQARALHIQGQAQARASHPWIVRSGEPSLENVMLTLDPPGLEIDLQDVEEGHLFLSVRLHDAPPTCRCIVTLFLEEDVPIEVEGGLERLPLGQAEHLKGSCVKVAIQVGQVPGTLEGPEVTFCVEGRGLYRSATRALPGQEYVEEKCLLQF
jgi:hypothetical protein